MVFPLGSELASVSDSDFHVYTCSFPEELLSAVSEHLEIDGLGQVRRGAEALRVELSEITKLRRCLFEICQSVRDDSLSASNIQMISKLNFELPSYLIQTISSATEKCPPRTGPKRLVAMARAEAFIEQYARDDIRVDDICENSGVSERTLQYAFLERFGMGPKEFLRAYRLSSVRRQLRASNPNTTKVVDIANAWGFWHMGQFAADFRERFGELPSKTLSFSHRR